ncbi:L-fucose/L-arabinose isomerase family protein [candidate division KSB1 bacterium]|nr:L-fucose/L-arabinose isomerase family protein [candidate division KSB1 bacterium]
MSSTTLGVLFGNRDFFPDHLVTEARKDIVDLFQKLNIKHVMLGEQDTKLGGVETFQDAQKCADLFNKNQDDIDGVLVVLPNFGDEKGVADTIKLSGLTVPILVQGYPDDLNQLSVVRRRDAYCGKISVCNNLRQANIPYTLTLKHVVYVNDAGFEKDLLKFAAVCRVVNGVRGARLGAVGARPGAFNTVRYSEKILEANGISVTTVDLSEILGKFQKLADNDKVVQNRLDEIKAYANVENVPIEYLTKMARLGVILLDFINENALDATAIQCWNSMQSNFGINVCTNMSMMSEDLMPSACEVDVTGVLTMYAMQLASMQPSALADWNNNYGQEEDKVVLFHCGNWAKSFVPNIKISTAPILGSTLGEENTYGAMEGRTPANPLTYGRITTDDLQGKMRAYIGEGQLTDDELNTFGTRAVAHIPNLEGLMQHVCENGFEHHVVMNASKTAGILAEAFQKYLNWDVYYHEKN